MSSIDLVPAFLGRQQTCGRHVRILALVAALIMLDGVDLQLLALTTPLIVDDWEIDAAVMAPALTAALVGMAVGTLVGGWLEDRLGRRRVILFSATFFGIMTLATSQAWDVTALTGIRFLAGCGFGAVTPNIYSLSGEIFPAGLRARVMGLLAVGIPLGGVIGAGIALVAIGPLGWRGCFVLVGVITIAVVTAAWRGLPESPSYYFMSGSVEKAVSTLHRITGRSADEIRTLADAVAVEVHDGTTATDGYNETDDGGIFGSRSLRLTVGASISFFALFFITYGFLNWQPALLESAGLALDTVLQASLVLNVMSTVGGLLVAVGLDRIGSRVTIISGAVVAAGVLASMPMLISVAVDGSGGGEIALFVSIAAIGFIIGYVGATLYANVAVGYPIRFRSSGVGFAAAVARSAGIVVTFTGGFLLSAATSGVMFFVTLVAMSVFSVIGALINNRQIVPFRRRLPDSRAARHRDARALE
ncbi:MFS transporter [Rhodococcus sp. USK10]|uniref:MFS transporter n=1 Tax=Rhodococcus TaxID=1827 RepID=UPI000F58B2B8|nr:MULTISPECIES: MFS transporter [Rhodococcus]QYB04699.1 MFS transporter [Rhodococcus sp. USK10]